MRKTKLPKPVEEEVAKLLGFVDFKRIITFNEKAGAIYIGGERVDESRLGNLKAESQFMLNSELWKVMTETIRHMAYEIMFTKSMSFEDMRSGKMLLYHLDTQKKIMDILSRFAKKPA